MDIREKKVLELIDEYENELEPGEIDVEDGKTILSIACDREFEIAARRMIDVYRNRCKPEHRDMENDMVLMNACYIRMEKVALKMIQVFGDDCKPEYVDLEHNTVFMCACECKLENVGLKMIEVFGHACNPGIVPNKCKSTLSCACEKKLEIVALKMIEVFGDECKPYHGVEKYKTAYDYAIKNKLIKVIDATNDKFKALNIVKKYCKKELADMLLECQKERQLRPILAKFIDINSASIISDYLFYIQLE